MLQTNVCNKGSKLHKEVSQFASSIYERRHGIQLETFPDVFCCAETKDQIVGCLGLYLGKNHDPLTLETYFPHNVIDSLSGAKGSRDRVGEMGTRAVDEELTHSSNISSGIISAVLAANIFIHASKIGLQHVVFTTNRTIRLIAKLLDANLIELGRPDLSRKDPSYLLKWKSFFNVPQFCFGVDVTEAVNGSMRYNNAMTSIYGTMSPVTEELVAA